MTRLSTWQHSLVAILRREMRLGWQVLQHQASSQSLEKSAPPHYDGWLEKKELTIIRACERIKFFGAKWRRHSPHICRPSARLRVIGPQFIN
jgi:hypothetical protein